MNTFLNINTGDGSKLNSFFSSFVYDKTISPNQSYDIWKQIEVNIPKQELYNISVFNEYIVQAHESLENISYKSYRTINFWWLIPFANDELNPFDFIRNVLDNEDGKYPDCKIKVYTLEYLSKFVKTPNDFSLENRLGSK
jgi:hypothetical protein